MSITSCTDCGVWIDTDKHPECYDEQDRPYCWDCARDTSKVVGTFTQEQLATMARLEADADEP
jgi:NAD-dependent SIR2 family protein deacetylase